jgi:hypothetical protein
MFRNYSLNRLLVFTASAGFGFLLADTTIEHFPVFNTEILCFIPAVFSLAGVILGLIAVSKWKPGIIRIMHYIFFLSIMVGALGFYLHVMEEENDKDLTTEERLHEAKEKEKPILAPLAFGGVAVIGLLGTYRKWPGEIVEK